ncbi:MAG: 1-deoxy-D-xylulose-5-phosphate reductoisomerase [Uliginosibacterium sp.]|nr:1-deoxy-D-xylulose-5-phosphate reductoisomerase [Uliginosibacterium sp.]
MQRQTVTILGATGSIGGSTLDVLSRHPERFEIYALTARRQIGKLADLCRRCGPRYAVVESPADAEELQTLLAGLPVTVLCGPESLAYVASAPEVTTVMAAIVGAAGLEPCLAAARAGKRVLLANKEALVMAGDLFMSAIRDSGAVLLPIDSEHNAVFQSLPDSFDYGLQHCGVRKIVLTASGGPFRHFPLERLCDVTPDQACAHPNWVMGRKISVDSATMMNKGLEVIEASWLFGVGAERIEVLIHPESVIHSMVEYYDGSVIAQLGNPDMRTPIAHALAYPDRIVSGVSSLDLVKQAKLSFEEPDLRRFPCLGLAYAALHGGGCAPTVLNAANEEAVAAFLEGGLRYSEIASVVEDCLASVTGGVAEDVSTVLAVDGAAREFARAAIVRYGRKTAT